MNHHDLYYLLIRFSQAIHQTHPGLISPGKNIPAPKYQFQTFINILAVIKKGKVKFKND